MLGADIFLWLAKILGGEVIKGQLARTGLKRELRTIKNALEESQNRRAELDGIDRILDVVWRERDDLLAKIARLHVENARLRHENEQLRSEHD